METLNSSSATQTAARPLVSLQGVTKVHGHGSSRVLALDRVDLGIEAGELLALTGPSGCGKTTLLHVVGAMARPTSGRVIIEGTDLADLDEDAAAELRRRRIGFVFQLFNLLPTLTVLENVALPLLLDRHPRGRAEDEAAALLARVGLEARSRHFPGELSGGELQRAAVARAVVARPPLVLADEPTGSLDSAMGRQVLDLLRELHRELGVTVLIATHSEEVASAARRRVVLRDGRIERIVT